MKSLCEWCPDNGNFDAEWIVLLGSEEDSEIAEVKLCSQHRDWLLEMQQHVRTGLNARVTEILIESVHPWDNTRIVAHPVPSDVPNWVPDPVTGGVPASWSGKACPTCRAYHSTQAGLENCKNSHYSCNQCGVAYNLAANAQLCEKNHRIARDAGHYQCAMNTPACWVSYDTALEAFTHAKNHAPPNPGRQLEIFDPQGRKMYTITDSRDNFFYTGASPKAILQSYYPPKVPQP
jgi:hypothetical protein